MAVLAPSSSLRPLEWTGKSTEVKITPLPNNPPPRRRSLLIFVAVVLVLVTVLLLGRSQGPGRDQRGVRRYRSRGGRYWSTTLILRRIRGRRNGGGEAAAHSSRCSSRCCWYNRHHRRGRSLRYQLEASCVYSSGGGGGLLGGSYSPRLDGKSNILEDIIRTLSRGHWMPVKKSECFDLPSTVYPSGTHLPGGNWYKIEIRIKKKSILIYFGLNII